MNPDIDKNNEMISDINKIYYRGFQQTSKNGPLLAGTQLTSRWGHVCPSSGPGQSARMPKRSRKMPVYDPDMIILLLIIIWVLVCSQYSRLGGLYSRLYITNNIFMKWIVA